MNKLIVAAAGMFLLTSGVAASADIEAGKKKATEVCAACHGPDGNSPTPQFPKIAGQHRDYLVKVLSDYKSGARKDPVMGGMATGLSKQDIENLAAYFASQKGLVTKY
ncbi:MAG: cytochrome c [Betaproteobacteria bacterium]|nr:cytochrome c [Betaproteobacteria bacterium]